MAGGGEIRRVRETRKGAFADAARSFPDEAFASFEPLLGRLEKALREPVA